MSPSTLVPRPGAVKGPTPRRPGDSVTDPSGDPDLPCLGQSLGHSDAPRGVSTKEVTRFGSY